MGVGWAREGEGLGEFGLEGAEDFGVDEGADVAAVAGDFFDEGGGDEGVVFGGGEEDGF